MHGRVLNTGAPGALPDQVRVELDVPDAGNPAVCATGVSQLHQGRLLGLRRQHAVRQGEAACIVQYVRHMGESKFEHRRESVAEIARFTELEQAARCPTQPRFFGHGFTQRRSRFRSVSAGSGGGGGPRPHPAGMAQAQQRRAVLRIMWQGWGPAEPT